MPQIPRLDAGAEATPQNRPPHLSARAATRVIQGIRVLPAVMRIIGAAGYHEPSTAPHARFGSDRQGAIVRSTSPAAATEIRPLRIAPSFKDNIQGATIKQGGRRRTSLRDAVASPRLQPGPYRFVQSRVSDHKLSNHPPSCERSFPSQLELEGDVVSTRSFAMPRLAGFGGYTETGRSSRCRS